MSDITPEREAIDNAVYRYFQSLGLDADQIDYSTIDEALDECVRVYKELGL